MTAHGSFNIIAHRGASGYLPEHTAVATAMAHGMKADFIEQDVALTKDGRALVIHDILLETTTDVAAVFPDRHRPDGRYYVIDFTADEIRQLRKGERIDALTRKAVYPNRYPAGQYDFPLLFLEEAVSLIQGMDTASGRITGLYPELKKPEFHGSEGMDPVPIFMEALKRSGALNGDRPCFIQCFHDETLRRIRREYGDDLTLIQLIGKPAWNESSTDYNSMLSPEGLREVATYANGIGLPLDRLVRVHEGKLEWTPVLEWAKAVNLIIHPFTLRKETLPDGIDAHTLISFLASEETVDGVFSDFPDIRP